jgi:hypothetical protein
MMESRRLDHMMNEVTTLHGHAAPILHIAATIGWQAKWSHEVHQKNIAEVVRLLVEAGELMGRIEADEAEERKLASKQKAGK